MRRDPDFSYLNEDGKLVSGTAAFLHHVYTEMGGIQNYNDEVGKAYIAEFVAAHSDIINDGLEYQARKKRLKLTG